MRAVWLFSSFSLAVAIAAQAQRPMGERERTSVTVIPERELFRVFPGNRGKIGITVSIDLEPSDSIGALVDAVTPAGPAYRAGIRAGDVIITLNGRSLVSAARETGRPTPGLMLIELATQMKAGDTARMEYRRNKERRQANVILEQMPMFMEQGMDPRFDYKMRTPGPEDGPDVLFERAQAPFFTENSAGGMVFIRTPIAELELAPMNPALGQYFGVNEGVLVINAPRGSRLNLRPGDVVLTVDGRRMSNPNQMFRALLSYEAGEDLKFEVMRMKRRETVTGRMGPNP